MPGSAPLDASASATWAGLRAQRSANVLLDMATATLVDANAAGASFWSGSRAQLKLPVQLDRAMPAWGQMRALDREQDVPALCLWTAAGAYTGKARVTPLGDGRHVAVILDAAPAASQRETPASSDDVDSMPGRHARNAKLAHELRTPIGAVAAYAEVLAGEHFGPLGNERYRSYAAICAMVRCMP